MPTTRLAQVFAQQLGGFRIEQTDSLVVPLHLNPSADPPWWRAVVGGLNFHAAVQMDCKLPYR